MSARNGHPSVHVCVKNVAGVRVGEKWTACGWNNRLAILRPWVQMSGSHMKRTMGLSLI